jgi:hypothetical protein
LFHHFPGVVADVSGLFPFIAVGRVEEFPAGYEQVMNLGDGFAGDLEGNAPQGCALNHEIEWPLEWDLRKFGQFSNQPLFRIWLWRTQ